MPTEPLSSNPLNEMQRSLVTRELLWAEIERLTRLLRGKTFVTDDDRDLEIERLETARKDWHERWNKAQDEGDSLRMERLRLRAALEQIINTVEQIINTVGGTDAVREYNAVRHLDAVLIAREALRGAVPAEEIPAGEPKPLPAHIGAAPAPSYQRRGGGCEPPGSAVETDAHHHQCPHCGTMWNDLTGRQAVPIPCKCKADKT